MDNEGRGACSGQQQHDASGGPSVTARRAPGRVWGLYRVHGGDGGCARALFRGRRRPRDFGLSLFLWFQFLSRIHSTGRWGVGPAVGLSASLAGQMQEWLLDVLVPSGECMHGSTTRGASRALGRPPKPGMIRLRWLGPRVADPTPSFFIYASRVRDDDLD